MASTIDWFGDNGGSDANAANNRDLSGGGTKFRFRTDDDWHTIDGVNPVPIPGAGTNYSGWIHFYAKMTARPGGTEVVNNFKLYTDGGGFGTGITVNVGNQYPANSSSAPESGYELATFNPVGTTGYLMTTAGPNGHSVITTEDDVFTKTSGSPEDLLDASFISETSNQLDAVGEMTRYFVMQAAVGTSAGAGVKTAETFTLRYDETE